MAINKNFVVKNGLEVGTKLIVADFDNTVVGVATTNPRHTLHVLGGIGGTDLNITGVSTLNTLKVTGIATIASDLFVTGVSTFTGTVDANGGATIDNIQIGITDDNEIDTSTGNLTIDSAGGHLTLDDNVAVTGTLNVTGISTFTGAIDANGGATIDNIQIGVTGDNEIDTSTGSLTIDSAGGTVTVDDNLRVTGVSTFVGIVTTTDDLFIGGDLIISEDLVLNTNLNILGIATIGRLHTTGIGTIDGDFRVGGISTFANTTENTLGNVNTGSVQLDGGLGVAKNTTIGAGLSVVGGLNVQGPSTFVGVVTTIGDLFVGGDLFISDDLVLDTNLNLLGIATVGRLHVTGIGTVDGDFRVGGITTFTNTTENTLGNADSGAIQIDGGLGVAKNATIGAGLSVVGGLNVQGLSTFTGAADFNGAVDIDGHTELDGVNVAEGISVTGVGTFLSSVNVGTSLTAASVLVGSAVTINSTGVNVAGVTTTGKLVVNSEFDVFDAQAVFHNNVLINGTLSIGGTTTVIAAQDLIVANKDIVLGYTTNITNDDVSNDNTANHGGVAVASTVGTPLVPFKVTGINTFPDTYKQIMWVKSGTFSGLGTDAWLFNYGVGIGSTQVPTGVRLAVSQIQMTDNSVNATNFVGTNINASGITSTSILIVGSATTINNTGVNITGIATVNGIQIVGGASIGLDINTRNLNASGITTTDSLSIGATQVISSGRQLQNIASLDAVTTATIESAISNAPNTFTDLKVTGITTLGITSATDFVADNVRVSLATTTARLAVTGIATAETLQVGNLGLNVTGVSTISVNSSSDAVRITQLGTGNAILVEDSVNPDATPFVVGAAGSVGIGITNPSGKLVVDGSASGNSWTNRSNLSSDSFKYDNTGLTVAAITADGSTTNGGVFQLYDRATGDTQVHLNSAPNAVSWIIGRNVGIGTDSPTSKLDVIGDTRVVGVVTATGGFNIGIQSATTDITTGVVTAISFVGSGNSITYRNKDASTKVIEISISGSGGGGGGVTEVKTSGISTTNAVGVGSFATATYRSAAVIAQINQNAQYQVGRYLMIHDGTTVTVLEESAVSTGSSMLGSFTGVIVGSNAELRVSMVSSGIATVTTKIDTVTV